ARARGFDADGGDGVLEGAALDQDVAHAAISLAAHRDAMTVEEGAIGDRNVLARAVTASLDGHVVVAVVREDVADEDVAAIARVDGIGIRRISRSEDLNAIDQDIHAASRHEVKLR